MPKCEEHVKKAALACGIRGKNLSLGHRKAYETADSSIYTKLSRNLCALRLFGGIGLTLASQNGRLDVPDVAGVFGNCAVAGKEAGAGDVQDGFCGPHIGFAIVFFGAMA